jgi:hypothetical protein
MNWLRRNAFLTDQERVSVEGVMTIDGVPEFAGCVTFTPVDLHSPVNEMFICATFSALCGWRNEQLKSDQAFVSR